MKKRRKQYKPKAHLPHPALLTARFFAPPLKLLRDIRHGEIWTINGVPMMVRADDTNPRPAAEVLRYFARLIVEIGAARGLAIDTTSLIRLAARLEADMPIDDGALRPVEEIFELASRLMASLPVSVSARLLTDMEEIPVCLPKSDEKNT